MTFPFLSLSLSSLGKGGKLPRAMKERIIPETKARGEFSSFVSWFCDLRGGYETDHCFIRQFFDKDKFQASQAISGFNLTKLTGKELMAN
jgi:hypothetical protein